jgi:L-rhamnose isomerase/sugar isomerase
MTTRTAGRSNEALAAFSVETPSWGYGDSGTRFGVFPQAGRPRDVFERCDDAAEVQRLTGTAAGRSRCTSPGTRSTTRRAARARRAELGLGFGAVNPNLFQDPDYKLGSVTNPDPAIRREGGRGTCSSAWDRDRAGLDRAVAVARGRHQLPGPGRPRRAPRALDRLPERAVRGDAAEQELLVEYKFFEPAFYATDIPDWGTATAICQRLGERARVLVDLGHHAQAPTSSRSSR